MSQPSRPSTGSTSLLIFTSLFLFLPTAARAQDEAIQSINNMSLMELILSVEWVLIPLAILSVGVIALIIFNFFWLRNNNVCGSSFEEAANVALKNRNLESLMDVCHEHESEACARVLLKTLIFAKANPTLGLAGLKEIAETEASRLAARISQPSSLLMDLGVLGPLVGLLGTVVGILKSFGNLASDATPMKTMLLAGGVSQALVATAMGLSIGLLAMGFYAFFRQRVASLIAFFENALTSLLVRTTDVLATPKTAASTPSTTPSPVTTSSTVPPTKPKTENKPDASTVSSDKQ